MYQVLLYIDSLRSPRRRFCSARLVCAENAEEDSIAESIFDDRPLVRPHEKRKWLFEQPTQSRIFPVYRVAASAQRASPARRRRFWVCSLGLWASGLGFRVSGFELGVEGGGFQNKAERCGERSECRFCSARLHCEAEAEQNLIAASVYDKYSIGLYIRPICIRCCLTMTHMIRVWSKTPLSPSIYHRYSSG